MGMLMKAAAELINNGYSEEAEQTARNGILSLPTATEEDYSDIHQAHLQILDLLIPSAPPDVQARLAAERRSLQALFDKRCAIIRITFEFVAGLQQGGNADQLSTAAIDAIQALPFEQTPNDTLLATEGLMKIAAISLAQAWFENRANEGIESAAILGELRKVSQALQQDGFDHALLMQAAGSIQKEPAKTAAARMSVSLGLFHVWGMGLLLRPDAGPALEPIRDRIFELSQQISAQDTGKESAAASSQQLTRSELILQDVTKGIQEGGVSMYLIQQTFAAINEMPQQTEADFQAQFETREKAIDLMMPHAEPEAAQNLAVMRTFFEKLQNSEALGEVTLDEFRLKLEVVLKELKQNLAAGEFPSVAVVRANLELSSFAMRLGDSDDKAGEEMTRFMMSFQKQMFSALQPYLPENSDNTFREVTGMMDMMGSALDTDLDDPAEAAVFERQFEEQGARLAQVVLAAQDESQIDAHPVSSLPHVRQFIALLPFFLERAFQTHGLGSTLGKTDKAESERLEDRIKRLTEPLKAAYSEEQVIRHQREGLRAAMLELRQFERRHYLTILHPALPTNSVTPDANSVFFSGTDSTSGLLLKACETIGMKISRKHGLQNQTHGRWQLMRRSGIAVFDYSAYDPKIADPPGEIRRSAKAEEKLLSAAGPTAMVAYETGWAYVLGMPLVIVARKGQKAPFDIELEPTYLEGDDHDVERLIEALQTAFYGPQEGIEGNCLADTFEQVGRLYGNADPQIKTLLASVTDVNDATRVQRILATVLDRIEGENSLLLCPAFPGSYPSGKKKSVFHITAFRDWSKGLQDETKLACKRAKLHYQIGYDRMTPDILRRIWNDICQASFVIADITNLNPNAVLELAMAQAVGRPTLILTRNKQPHTFFPAIQKVRTHYYDPDKGRPELATVIDAFLAGSE